MSTDIGAQPVEAQLTIPANSDRLYISTVVVTITSRNVTIQRDVTSCVERLVPCSVTETVPLEGDVISLQGTLYVGGVPEFTPYIRSKFRTTEGFRGCLGVSPAVV